MRFGLFYEHQLPRPWRTGDEGQLSADALEQIELADRLGLDCMWLVAALDLLSPGRLEFGGGEGRAVASAPPPPWRSLNVAGVHSETARSTCS